MLMVIRFQPSNVNKMAKKEETSTSDGIKAEDAIFMAECLKHLQTPANVCILQFLTVLILL